MFRIEVMDVKRDWPWIAKNLRCHLVEDSGGFVAFDREGKYAAAMLFDSFTATAACCHVIVQQPLVIRSGFFQIVAKGIFVHANRKVLLGITPSDNEKALRFKSRLGFEEIYRIRSGYTEQVDLVVSEMRRENCRWLSQEDR